VLVVLAPARFVAVISNFVATLFRVVVQR